MIIRPARPEDGDAVADVRVVSWRATYRGVVPGPYLDTMDANRAHWRSVAAGELAGAELLVCEVDGAVVGFACYGAARPPAFGFGGELYATYYLPEAMGKGYGSAMLHAVIGGLKRQGHADMIVWVMEANARGRNFYEKILRMTPVEGSRQSFVIGDSTIWEVAYGLRPLPDSAAAR
ncbi:MAG: GNAT family N-acetyltransferase [Steroidobacteraceae bacterium]